MAEEPHRVFASAQTRREDELGLEISTGIAGSEQVEIARDPGP
jgi:hypothetical protein